MRISDWSSDVCSSDLPARSAAFGPVRHLGYGQLVASPGIADRNRRTANSENRAAAGPLLPDRPPAFHTAHAECGQAAPDQTDPSAPHRQIGTASSSERV